MPVHHSPKGRQKGKGKAGVAKTPTKSCVVDSGGHIVVTVDMISTDRTVEQHSAKAAACHKAECEIEKVAAHQKAENGWDNESDMELADDEGYQVKRAVDVIVLLRTVKVKTRESLSKWIKRIHRTSGH